MTYKSDQDKTDADLVTRITLELDKADNTLPEKVVSDITQARYAAMRKAKDESKTQDLNKGSPFSRIFSSKLVWTLGATPAAVALVAVVLVSYGSRQGIPELPVELVSEEVSVEDLMLVTNMELAQDLEFANWLAQQSEEGLL